MPDNQTQAQITPMRDPRPGNAQWLGTRTEQQDAFGFAGYDGQGQAGPDGVLAVVADGMGGMCEGRAASQEAVKTFLAAWAARPTGEPVPDRLLAAIQAANRAVADLAHDTAGAGEVGTTLVAATVYEGRLFWIAAGDSRIYFYRAADASLTPCNEEHNLALELWRQYPGNGQTPGSIASHPERASLTSFLGLAEIPEIDRNIRALTLEAGDRLLLCSDGVDGVLTPEEMRRELTGDPQAAAEGLIARLKTLGRTHQDNATVAILACPGPASAPVAVPAETPTPPNPSNRRWIAYVAGVLVLLSALGAGGWYGFLSPSVTATPQPADIAAPPVSPEQDAPKTPTTDAATPFAPTPGGDPVTPPMAPAHPIPATPAATGPDTNPPPVEPQMVSIQAGSFSMGCQPKEKECQNNEKPAHRVQVAAFEIGKYEVTFAEWDACVAAGVCKYVPVDQGWGRGQRPVINVSWDDAQEYAHWLNRMTGKAYRLPTEAEWEYAARAGTKTPFSTGDCISTAQANYNGHGTDHADCGAKTGKYFVNTQPVGSYPANPWGLHDVHGNVWEWVQDCEHADYEGAPRDGSEWGTSCAEVGRRVVRGGSWNDKPGHLRSANRKGDVTDARESDHGFRLARTYIP